MSDSFCVLLCLPSSYSHLEPKKDKLFLLPTDPPSTQPRHMGRKVVLDCALGVVLATLNGR